MHVERQQYNLIIQLNSFIIWSSWAIQLTQLDLNVSEFQTVHQKNRQYDSDQISTSQHCNLRFVFLPSSSENPDTCDDPILLRLTLRSQARIPGRPVARASPMHHQTQTPVVHPPWLLAALDLSELCPNLGTFLPLKIFVFQRQQSGWYWIRILDDACRTGLVRDTGPGFMRFAHCPPFLRPRRPCHVTAWLWPWRQLALVHEHEKYRHAWCKWTLETPQGLNFLGISLFFLAKVKIRDLTRF